MSKISTRFVSKITMLQKVYHALPKVGSNHFWVFFCIMGMHCSSLAQEIPAGGVDQIDTSKLKFLKLNKEEGTLTVDSKSPTVLITAITIKQPKFVYNLGITIPLRAKKIETNQPLLLVFEARTVESSLETAEAKVNWVFKQTKSNSPKDIVENSVSLSSKWQTYYVPFQALHTSIGEAILQMRFGYTPQKFELRNLHFIAYPKTFNFNNLPKTKITYPGMEANAPWRSEAQQRIEKIRKGDFSITFTKNGKAVTNAKGELHLVQHYFPFGAALHADDIVNNPKHLDYFKKLFSIAVFENDLKAKRWIREKNRPITLQAISILNQNGIKVKGHVLLWPGFNYLPTVYADNQNDPKKIRNMVDQHVTSILNATKGSISHWDVLNEVYTNKDLQKITGSDEILFDAFKKAKQLDPNAKRFINEYGIISGGGINSAKQQWYHDFIKTIDKNTHNLVDGIGMQSHIGSDLTPPEKIIEILDYFSDLKKNISISEFTLDLLDDDLKAQYTTDFVTAAFSHPSVTEFLFWGYYEPNNPKAGLYDKNFKLTKMGQAFDDLIHKKWTTTISFNSLNNGILTGTAFFGTYEYTIAIDGKTYKGILEWHPNSSKTFNIELQ